MRLTLSSLLSLSLELVDLFKYLCVNDSLSDDPRLNLSSSVGVGENGVSNESAFVTRKTAAGVTWSFQSDDGS